MMNKRLMLWLGALLFLTFLISGCKSEPRSETIIIPSKDENFIDDQGSRPFHVKTIYRLPDNLTDQLLGWSAPDSVIGVFSNASADNRVTLGFQRLTPPYEDPEFLRGLDNMNNLVMSPDGKRITGVIFSTKGTSLKLFLLPDGKETEVATNTNPDLFLQDVTWSNNSRYLCFLFIDAVKGQSSIGVYDTDSGTLKTYGLKDIDTKKSLTGVNISDDGRSFLITTLQFNRSGKYNSIIMGTINGSDIKVQYEQQVGQIQNAWLNNDQFVYLGVDGTLYEYDRRNGELSVLLEKVGSFEFSQDRKYIAYSQHDNDTIYAAKFQGKNVLHKEPIYHGIVPSQMFWSPNNNNLLIYGHKFYASLQSPPGTRNPLDEKAYIISFK
ncbi:WD40 repeat domain-containing protein [Virgibacillus proomii]|uniref:WD40 repeat domain-containing protein n=1 Tax=Virgibacillus proomii TaxID=84407 RepID=UPI001C1209B7|nr:WD40 repeat domain-containing protein [Virgibacillus proomii]MBU5266524.1 WD40 repeat domain-containing protein [Virgibacillus proomii]